MRYVVGKRPRLGSSAGFTLVELMVVVGILGILSTIGITQYDQFMAKSRITRTTMELAQLKQPVDSLKALYGFYPATTNWMGALPYSQEYQVDCSTVSMGTDPENIKGVREVCDLMSAYNPRAPGEPQQSPYCGEPRGFLYLSNGFDYQLLAYCFDRAELSRAMKASRCAGNACWGLAFYSHGGSQW